MHTAINREESAIKAAVDLLAEQHGNLSDMLKSDGLLKPLIKGLLEKALEGELEDHLGYKRHERSDSSNARNGKQSKQLMTDHGEIELSVPRDRCGEFSPEIVPKGVSRISGLDGKILSLYAKGLSLQDIKEQLSELYGGVQISESVISRVTDQVIEEVKLWQSRPLERVYPIVYFDALVVKVRQDKRIINKAVYIALGISQSGHKDILGLWISENEGAKFWLQNFTELKNRGLEDILIACTDNLTGMADAIESVYPRTEHQLCIVHQIRNSLKYVSYKHKKAVARDLKVIYSAATEDEALLALEAFEEQWNQRYPQIAKSWQDHWSNLVIFLQYPQAIRRVIYTTNAIESLNSQLRKTTKNKKVFPNDNSVFKIMYLTIERIMRKWSMPVTHWNEAMAHFSIKFSDRIKT